MTLNWQKNIPVVKNQFCLGLFVFSALFMALISHFVLQVFKFLIALSALDCELLGGRDNG